MTIKNLFYLLNIIYFSSCHNSKEEKTYIDSSIATYGNYDESNWNCVYKKDTNNIESLYPFNVADSIILVSYEQGLSKEGFPEDWKLIKNGVFMIPKIKEHILLNKTQIDSLISILCNFKAKKFSNIVSVSCYIPKHSIVFYNKGKAIAYIEVSLECSDSRMSYPISPRIENTFCNEKWSLIRNYFKWCGITYGLDNVPRN